MQDGKALMKSEGRLTDIDVSGMISAQHGGVAEVVGRSLKTSKKSTGWTNGERCNRGRSTGNGSSSERSKMNNSQN